VEDGRFEAFTTGHGLPCDVCAPALVDQGGSLWAVSPRALVRRSNGVFRFVGPDAGLPDDLIFGLVEDDFGDFWLPGQRGIHRVSRREVEEYLDGRRARIESVTLGVGDGLLTPD